jgi:hypothetical protein
VADYLLPISDRDPLAWIVAEQRTAVGAHRRQQAESLQPGDRIWLYTTRGCYRNPTRDRGRVIGEAEVAAKAREVKDPVRFGDREYPIEVPLKIKSLVPQRAGVELASLLDQLESFPNRRAWSAYMRRALVPLTDTDGRLLERELRPHARPYAQARETYLR